MSAAPHPAGDADSARYLLPAAGFQRTKARRGALFSDSNFALSRGNVHGPDSSSTVEGSPSVARRAIGSCGVEEIYLTAIPSPGRSLESQARELFPVDASVLEAYDRLSQRR